ncbi:MAG: hypothetical protein IT292_01000 [Deltaproteobacteria bacterium]|nr:hypothetical protein [Deltaproteobacteria bacterium]
MMLSLNYADYPVSVFILIFAFMIRLPKFLPPFLIPLLDGINEFRSLEEFLTEFVKRVSHYVKGEYAITGYSTGGDPIIVSVGHDKRGEYFQINEILNIWVQSGLHDQVLHDLRNRNSSVSYSSYSWPYQSSDKVKLLSGKEFNFPCQYQLLIPFASAHLYRLENDLDFYGYSAYFFSDFAEFSDQVIQALISLPEVLSDIVQCYIRSH